MPHSFMYDLSIQNLGKNFISTKYNVLHEQTIPKFLKLALLTSTSKLKELNYWYLLLFSGQSPGVTQQKVTRKKRRQMKLVIKKKKTLLILNLLKITFNTTLQKFSEQLLYLKNPAHTKISKFSKHGEKFYALQHCETYNVHRTVGIQKENNFYISDIGIILFIKLYTQRQITANYIFSFFQHKQNNNYGRRLLYIKYKLIFYILQELIKFIIKK